MWQLSSCAASRRASDPDTLQPKLREREEQLVRACEVANNSADVLNIENSFDGLADEVDCVQEPW